LLGMGCASPKHERALRAPSEILDEQSATTLIIVRQPIVLARSRIDAAANVRDYLTLVVAREDRSGKYVDWLVVYRWSTLDSRFDSARVTDSGRLLLMGDGRSIALNPVERGPQFLARGDLLFAPRFALNVWAYAVDLPTLRYLASTRELSSRLQDDPLPQSYGIWDDGRPQLRGLLEGAAQ